MLYNKILQLNQTIIECINETDEKKIIRAFTDLGIKIIEADFGFVWFKSYSSTEFKLMYKSKGTPYTPKIPHKDGRNHRVIKSRVPDYVSRVKKRDDVYDVSKYMKSFVIIPISHRKNIYGSIVLCFKKPEIFSREGKILCQFIGNSVADAITIHRLLESEQEKSRIEFIAEAAHELRTPLAIMKGNIDLALQKKSGIKNTPEALRTFRILNEEINHLAELISDISLLVSLNKSTHLSQKHKKYHFPI